MFDIPHIEGIRLTLYKSVIPTLSQPTKWNFFLWGASNFLLVDKFKSLSQFSFSGTDDVDTQISLQNQIAENRYLYIYKDQETNLNTQPEVDWIFKPDIHHPLIVITLLKADIQLIIPKLKQISDTTPLIFDVFKMLGYGTGVLIFRCQEYSQVLNYIVDINELRENTYSIAGADNPFTAPYPKRGKNDLLYSEILLKDSEKAYVAVNYVLKEGDGNRVRNVTAKIKQLRQEIIDQFPTSEQALELEIAAYYEIGRFDIEVQIKGKIAYILELLLNPQFGLVNISSRFYKEHIFESRTTWKKSIPLS